MFVISQPTIVRPVYPLTKVVTLFENHIVYLRAAHLMNLFQPAIFALMFENSGDILLSTK